MPTAKYRNGIGIRIGICLCAVNKPLLTGIFDSYKVNGFCLCLLTIFTIYFNIFQVITKKYPEYEKFSDVLTKVCVMLISHVLCLAEFSLKMSLFLSKLLFMRNILLFVIVFETAECVE